MTPSCLNPRPRRTASATRLAVALALAHAAAAAAVGAEQLPGFDEAVRILSERLVGFTDVEPDRLAEGALRGILSVVDPQAKIIGAGGEAGSDDAAAPGAPAEHRMEILSDRFLYLGAKRMDPEAADALKNAPLAPDACDGLILDLRSAPGTDLGVAAAFVSAFLEPGTRIFSVEGPSGNPTVHFDAAPVSSSWQQIPVVALIGPQTGPAAEAAAGGLRDLRRAVLIGHPTPGGAVERESISLPGGRTIRLATRRVRFPSGAVLFPLGAQPDVTIREDEQAPAPLRSEPQPRPPEGDVTLDIEEKGEDLDEPPMPIDAEPSPDAPGPATDAGAGPDRKHDATVQVAVDILKGFRALRVRP